MKVTRSRLTSREGVNAVRALFEKAGCVFQEVAEQNDYGKDAYIDVGRNGSVTPLCVAVQIKAGESYRCTEGYRIPVDEHARNWRESTVPVFGLVFDPSDAMVRWGDLTGYLREHPEQDGGAIPIETNRVLNESTLADFAAAVDTYSRRRADIAVQLLSTDDGVQDDAVFNAWALGRSDGRHLLLLRRLLLELRGRALRRAICLLSHAGSHPDILWTPHNWIPPSVAEQALPSFVWSAEEIAHMLRVIEEEEWGRGTVGQCCDVLLYEDRHVTHKARAAVGLLLADGSDRDSLIRAIRAAAIALEHSKDARGELATLLEEYPSLGEHEWFCALAAMVDEQGWISFYV